VAGGGWIVRCPRRRQPAGSTATGYCQGIYCPSRQVVLEVLNPAHGPCAVDEKCVRDALIFSIPSLARRVSKRGPSRSVPWGSLCCIDINLVSPPWSADDGTLVLSAVAPAAAGAGCNQTVQGMPPVVDPANLQEIAARCDPMLQRAAADTCQTSAPTSQCHPNTMKVVDRFRGVPARGAVVGSQDAVGDE
jgi:hypothetical protein